MTEVVDIPTFASLAESRAFFQQNPHLNPSKAPRNGAHTNAHYVNSKPGRVNSKPIRVAPHRITDVFLQEQFDDEGDTVWALWGRGLMLTTYSIREVEHYLSTVLTTDEQQQAADRRASLRSLIVRLEGDAIPPPEHEARPALEVVEPQQDVTEYLGHRVEVTSREVIAYTPEGVELVRSRSMAAVRLAIKRNRAEQDEAEAWTPAPDHPWRKPKREVAA